jgi:hypothetical protein
VVIRHQAFSTAKMGLLVPPLHLCHRLDCRPAVFANLSAHSTQWVTAVSQQKIVHDSPPHPVHTHVHAAYPYCKFMSMPHVLASCLCFTSLLHVHASCQCFMSMPHVHYVRYFDAACPYCMSILHVHATFSCCMFMLPYCMLIRHILAACPCCTSKVHVSGAFPSCMSLLHVSGACP